MDMMIRKMLVFVALAGASFMYVFTRGASPTVADSVSVSNPQPTPAPTPTPAPAPTGMMGGTMPPKARMMGAFKDGMYKGSVADAFYGLVQVQATITSGRLTDITFLSYPSDQSTSRFINSQAMPMLIQEAISAQSARVSGVSGATETSGAFRESLAVALVAAKN